MRNWKVTGKYPQSDSTGAVASTYVVITDDDGAVIPQLIKQDLTSANDTETIKAVLEEFKKSEYVEIAMGEAVQKVDDLEKISQETAKTAKTAQTAAGLAKVSAERTQKMINLQTIHVLTSGGKIDPDIYKGMLELIEPVKKVSTKLMTCLQW
ncbi:phage protein [Streptococcus dysgalactiae]|nr:phage protein [Streptococcus dysgalactiae]